MKEAYDITIHLAGQIENFLNSYNAADIAAMSRVKENFKDICKNSELKTIVKQIEEWDKNKNTEINKIYKKAQTAIKTIMETKNGEELFIDLEEIKNDIVNNLNQLEKQYWDHIRNLMLESVKTEQ